MTVLNINRGKNEDLLEQCRTLKEYMIYTNKVRDYAAYLPLEEAVERAVQECIEEGVLADFLTRNRKEAIEVSIFEYDEERVMQEIRKDEFARGIEQGIEKGIERGIEQGIEQGEKRMLLLGKGLLAEGRIADLEKAMEDEEYREKLYQEFGV